MPQTLTKVVTLFCTLVFMLMVLAQPSLASSFPNTHSDQSDLNNHSQNFVKKCLLSQPKSGLGEIVCDAGKTVATAGIVISTCLAADFLASGIFPPALALAPACNFLSVTTAGGTAVAGSALVAAKH